MKILVIYASAGAGHMKAAEAIMHGLKKYTSHQVVFVDGLDTTSSFCRNFYREVYKAMISYVPAVWGFFFGLLDLPWLQGFSRWIRRIVNSIQFRGLEQYLLKEQFDWIVTTHFMPTEVAAFLKRKGKISSKLLTVVTDYDVHRIWTASHVDLYAVATDWTREKVKTLGVSTERVVVTGIPTDEKFSEDKDVGVLKRKLGLHPDTFTLLMATGSFGIGPIEEILQSLQGFQVMVICGHNKTLYERLTQKKYPLVKVLGFVDNVHELMAVSDVMITKPGGLSVSEALVSQTPLVFFNIIPGQEAGNVRVLKMYGLGSSPGSVQGIVEELNRLRDSRDTYLTLLKRSKMLARPLAVKDIISLLK